MNPLPRPELIMLQGPQAGERVVLMGDRAIAGRSPTSDVNLAEPFISREHLEFRDSPDGWLVECLSTKGMTVAGKKYKPGKQVLLETGDTLQVGGETLILYVAAGDDPETALKDYREAHGLAPLPVAPTEPPAAPAPSGVGSAVPQPPAPKTAVLAPSAGKPAPALLNAAEVPDDAAVRKRAKLKKYAIFGSIYALLLVGLVVFLSTRSPGEDPSNTGAAAILSDEQIEKALSEKYPESRNAAVAASELGRARACGEPHTIPDIELYNVVRLYKSYLASNDAHVFEEAKDEARYNTVLDRLAEAVKQEYSNGVHFEKSGRWRESYSAFRRLRTLLPERDGDTAVVKVILNNVDQHTRRLVAIDPSVRK